MVFQALLLLTFSPLLFPRICDRGTLYFCEMCRHNAFAAVDDSVVLSMFPLENGHQGLRS